MRVNFHFSIEEREGKTFFHVNRNGNIGDFVSGVPLAQIEPEDVIMIAQEMGCTATALSKAIDQYKGLTDLKSNISGGQSKMMGPRLCDCGCGEEVTSLRLVVKFKQGHDARLKSRLLKQMRDPKNSVTARKEAEDELQKRGWLHWARKFDRG
jgi:hypothetical protein